MTFLSIFAGVWVAMWLVELYLITRYTMTAPFWGYFLGLPIWLKFFTVLLHAFFGFVIWPFTLPRNIRNSFAPREFGGRE